MALSPYRMHKIYHAATMKYGLGSKDPEELAYYNKIRGEMDEMKKKTVKKESHLDGINKWVWILFYW